ncbi:cilia-and flagella-associated protein 96 isoform X2 [Hypanus sabinus]|uniref:cilia-and flagella-associated protein 96 isoform X2 n=1 Tax=Hypanus sabinus TaxID=79690 RepID=UPI0028C3D36B|nr:cilia-and flagella-associated protein 96 isoform X2 [Hypanus sabinus]
MPGDSGKTDMERIGLFQEMPYITVQDPYADGMPKPFNESAYKGKQMLSNGPKSKCATQAGYFNPEFVRIFENESYSDKIKLRRQARLKSTTKNLGGVFFPSQGAKKPCGLGTYYGTIGGSFEAFSGLPRAKPPFVPENKNIYTSPGKQGTGYGYAHLTIGESYEHSPDPYTIKSTKPGGMKAGTFDEYPSHFSPLAKPSKVDPKSRERLIFHPNPGLKSRPIKSVLLANVNRVVNSMNYKSIDRIMSY